MKTVITKNNAMPKTIVITGATSGIGYSTALAFAKLGANVAISGRRADRGAEAAAAIEKLGGRAWFKATDVQNAHEVREFVEGAVDVFGTIDTVITNAGIEPPHVLPLADLTVEDIDAVFGTNIRGTLLTAKYAIPHLRCPGGVDHYGVITMGAAGWFVVARLFSDKRRFRISDACTGSRARWRRDPRELHSARLH
jgi:NAD(P)-dependent dehydrogenase (short-subunit alcohol dehydrogenase family)